MYDEFGSELRSDFFSILTLVLIVATIACISSVTSRNRNEIEIKNKIISPTTLWIVQEVTSEHVIVKLNSDTSQKRISAKYEKDQCPTKSDLWTLKTIYSGDFVYPALNTLVEVNK